jgi:hypothetical protein
MIKDLCIRESYKDKNGDDKVSWNRIGILFDGKEGKQYVKLNHIPGVLISVFARKVSGKVLDTKIDENGAMLAKIQLNGKLPPKGADISIKWGSQRTRDQNALYWVYLNWLIHEAGLKDQGHFSEDALHIDLKTHILAEKIFDKGKFKAIEEATTADLTRTGFSEYFNRVQEVVLDIFGVDSAPFFIKENAPVEPKGEDAPF